MIATAHKNQHPRKNRGSEDFLEEFDHNLKRKPHFGATVKTSFNKKRYV